MVDDFWKWLKKGLYRNFFKYIGTPTSRLLGPDTASLLGMIAMFGGFFLGMFACQATCRPVAEAIGVHPLAVASVYAVGCTAWMFFWMGASFWREDRD